MGLIGIGRIALCIGNAEAFIEQVLNTYRDTRAGQPREFLDPLGALAEVGKHVQVHGRQIREVQIAGCAASHACAFGPVGVHESTHATLEHTGLELQLVL